MKTTANLRIYDVSKLKIFSLTGENLRVKLHQGLTDGLCQTGVGAMKYSVNWMFSPVVNLVFS